MVIIQSGVEGNQTTEIASVKTNGNLTVFNTVLGVLLAILLGFIVRNTHQNAVKIAQVEKQLENCCANR